jgi:hypothetical protein
MKKPLFTLLLLAFLIGLAASPALAQSWVTYDSEKFDIQFAVPDYWSTDVDGDLLVSEGDGVVFVLTAVKEGSISTEELFFIQVDNLDMDSEIEYEEVEMRGGMLGIIGSGAGTIEGQVVGVILLAATFDENNYLAYIFATPESFEAQEGVMVDVLTSLAPYGWIDQ